MASFPIGTHLSPSQHLRNRPLHSPFHGLRNLESSISLSSSSFFGHSSCRIRGLRLLGNHVLARAEDKARGSTSSFQQQQAQQSSKEQFQDLTSESGTCDPLCSVDETSSRDFEETYQPKTDLLKALAVFAAAATGAVAINQSWVAANQDFAMALLFGIGYAGIIFEESLAFNKSGVGPLMAVSLWVIRSIGVMSILYVLRNQ